MVGFDLHEEARRFAQRLTDILNQTVCNNVRITPVVSKQGRAVLGYKIDKDNQDQIHGIPLTIVPGKKPRAYMGMMYRLRVDDEQRHLAVISSFVGLFCDEELEHALIHYDYERDKGDDYPEAHIQVCAESAGWTNLLGAGEPLQKLHLPVGGRRFRPCIEDFIDMLVTEGLVEGRPDWDKRVLEGRAWFHRLQLKAAIRRDPEAALEALSALERDGALTGTSTWKVAPTPG